MNWIINYIIEPKRIYSFDKVKVLLKYYLEMLMFHGEEDEDCNLKIMFN